ncbi:MAG: hypothetical protein ACWGON_08720, partial [Gemmatimonadota bacterium]
EDVADVPARPGAEPYEQSPPAGTPISKRSDDRRLSARQSGVVIGRVPSTVAPPRLAAYDMLAPLNR